MGIDWTKVEARFTEATTPVEAPPVRAILLGAAGVMSVGGILAHLHGSPWGRDEQRDCFAELQREVGVPQELRAGLARVLLANATQCQATLRGTRNTPPPRALNTLQARFQTLVRELARDEAMAGVGFI